MVTENRPWGSYTVLEERGSYKVKRIEISPGKRLSYQRHEKRSEHWVDISRMAAHRVLNPGNGCLTMIEVQRGDYLGEDDIIRLEDDFGRIPA
jgi:mannose-6-phosphate isomerase